MDIELVSTMFGTPPVNSPFVKNSIRLNLARILKIDEIKGFIGNHPVNITKERLKWIINNNYLVCEKTDGIRIILYINNSTVFILDRNDQIYKTDAIFEKLNSVDFLFDGELYEENNEYILSIFDCLVYANKRVLDYSLLKRLYYCTFFVNNYCNNNYFKFISNKYTKFRIVAKQMIKSYGCESILKNISKLNHKNDGLIFTPVDEPYVLYQRSKIIKWKPPKLNTIDFLIKKTSIPYIYTLYALGESSQFKQLKINNNMNICAGYYICDDDSNTIFHNNIGEFFWNSTKEIFDFEDGSLSTGGWELYKLRYDKATPNNIKIILDQFEALDALITEDELISYLPEIKYRYKERQKKIADGSKVVDDVYHKRTKF